MIDAVKPPPGAARRERSRQTRERILSAAHALFVERGYAATTMNDVAGAASVAMQTIYFIFHSKTELLGACVSRAVLGPESPSNRSTRDETWLDEALAQQSLLDAVGLFVDQADDVLARAAPLDRVVRAALHAPELAALQAEGESQRRAAYRHILLRLASRFAPSADLDELTDAAMMLLGPQAWTYLVDEMGWPRNRWRRWTATVLTDQLSAQREG